MCSLDCQIKDGSCTYKKPVDWPEYRVWQMHTYICMYMVEGLGRLVENWGHVKWPRKRMDRDGWGGGGN